jgi:MFS family permease
VRRLEWNPTLRVLALLLTAFWIAAAVLQVVLMSDLTGAPPGPKANIQDDLMAMFAFDYARWPIDFASQLLFALGFLALAGIGILLARLADAFDERGSLGPGLFIGSGLLGTAASLIWIGVKPFATFPHYCPCDLRDAELAARIMILNATGTATAWLTIGAIALAALGLLLVAELGRRAGMSRALTSMTYLAVVVGLVAAVLGALAEFNGRDDPWGLISDVSAVAVAGVVIPLWAVWLAIRAPSLAPPGESTEEPMESALPG